GDDGVRAELGRDCLQTFTFPRGESQLVPVLAERSRDREPDPRRASGDERGLGHDAIFTSRKVRYVSRRTWRRGTVKAPPLPCRRPLLGGRRVSGAACVANRTLGSL